MWVQVAAVIVMSGVVYSALPDKPSPCPELFRYETGSQQKSNQWSGSLTFLSDSNLYGIWTRVIFTSPVAELTVGSPNFEVVADDNRMEFLIKDRNSILKANIPQSLLITAKYEGNVVPALERFRLNAKIVCPLENTYTEGDLFENDIKSRDYLKQILLNKKPISTGEADSKLCGVLPSKQPEQGQWPWQAQIYYLKGGKRSFVCDATLISSSHVLTSAHCVAWKNTNVPVNAKDLIVELSIMNSVEGNSGSLPVRQVMIYPGYQHDTLLNDIAIIKLQGSVPSNINARPACLPAFKGLFSIDGFVIGRQYNKNEFKEVGSSKVKTITGGECSKIDRELASVANDNQFCGAYEGGQKSDCVGSSGSGVVGLRPGTLDTWELQGIVNLGRALHDTPNCEKNRTFLILSVENYLKWIKASVF